MSSPSLKSAEIKKRSRSKNVQSRSRSILGVKIGNGEVDLDTDVWEVSKSM